MQLLAAREAAGLEGPPTWVEWVKYIRRVVDALEAVADQMLQVLQVHRELDNQCRLQAASAGMEVEDLTVADVAYPLITRKLREREREGPRYLMH
jgi:hypothetical protein